MSVLKTYLAAFFLVLASAGIGLVLWHLAGLSTAEASLAVACLLLGAAQLLGYLSRDTRQERAIAQVNDLSLASAQAVRDIDALKHAVVDLQQEVSRQGSNRHDELNSQFQVLETLVKQLAEQVSNSRTEPALVDTNAGEPAAGEAAAGANGHGGPSDAELIETVRRSLENNRVDLYLQPLVTLPQRKTRYYEALTRLRDASGDVILPSSYLQVAEHAGIMPMIDNLLLFRCVKVMRRLIERNREIGVFCNISARSLLDAEFFPQFLEFMQQNQEHASSLVFELAQSTVENAGPLEIESITLLHEMGFRFSMDHVVNLDINFQSLADLGFAFLKVDAHTLIDGMNSSGAQIHSADLKALIGRFGIELIAEKIETERQVVTLLDYQVGLGQGYLFSEPRLVREEIIESSRRQDQRQAL
jgi:cyclic-di-GMP phosphodiesterase TipF (flagellum assembly factor)